jgi:hypothetical protein
MARKSVTVKLTPRQAFAVLRATHDWYGPDAERVFAARSAVFSALYDDGWVRADDGSWTKEVKGG